MTSSCVVLGAPNPAHVRWQDMRVKADKAKDLPAEAKETADTVGIWHPVYDHRLAIKHLYFMRQLPPDVAANKVSSSAALRWLTRDRRIALSSHVAQPMADTHAGTLQHLRCVAQAR